MYSFEGDFRRRPQQSLGGASKKEKRDELLQRACAERMKREENRRKTQGAICIQSFVRGALIRRKQWRIEQQKFTQLQQDLQHQQQLDERTLEQLIQSLLFFYRESEDASRLLWFHQILLRHTQLMAALVCGQSSVWTFRIKKLLDISLRYLTHIANTNAPIALPMRIIEVFTVASTYESYCSQIQTHLLLSQIFTFLIRRGFFRHMYILINEKVPNSLEKSSTPPTPLAGSLYNFLIQPIDLIPLTRDYGFRKLVLHSLSQEFFCKASTEQLVCFVIPALIQGIPNFPFAPLLETILDTDKMTGWPVLSVQPSPYLFSVVLQFASYHVANHHQGSLLNYLRVLYCLRQTIHTTEPLQSESDSEDEDEDGTQVRVAQFSQSNGKLRPVIEEIVTFLNESWHVQLLLSILEQDSSGESLKLLCYLCYELLVHQKMSMNEYKLLYTLAFTPKFLKALWLRIVSSTTESVFGMGTPCLQMLARGLCMRSEELKKFVPLLSLFCCLFSYMLHTLHDSELCGDTTGTNFWVVQSSLMHFSVNEIIVMSLALRDVCLGLVELEFPDAPRSSVPHDYRLAMDSVSGSGSLASTEGAAIHTRILTHLFKVAVDLVRQLYNRDSRQSFCPKGHWISSKVNIPVEKPLDINLRRGRLRMYRPFFGVRAFSRDMMEEGPPLSVMELRNITILRELSFVVPFADRVMILQQLIAKDKMDNQGEMSNFLAGPQIQVLIRRNYIYEDAFDKLSLENEPNLKLKMRVHLVNAVGLDEAGIDGGGIFREFLSELLKTGFDPNRGFFKLSHDNMLYPNPDVHLLVDNFGMHYFFIGRMLGKALYENMLVELPLASFFSTKLLSRHSGKVDIHHLESLDPVMYRNLLYLKHYDGDVTDLGLDFTVTNSVLGETHVEELKLDGANIAVTNTNRIKYIHLMADYKLNRQIRAQCEAFRLGLSKLINLEWLQMFDARELQVLISGASVPVDLQDLKEHTTYSGGYTIDHPVIKSFWKVVENMDDRQRKQLLKFVTSCSRPPLLGFKELYPAFCIQNAGQGDRLPTASTCMNLLKLPEFHDETVLKTKLLYAIESCSGFELS